MSIAYVMQSFNASSEAWMQRQIQFLGKKIGYLAAIDNKQKKLNSIDVVNLYENYPVIYKLMMKVGIMRKRTRDERFNYVFDRSVAKNKPSVILINYLNLAYKLKDTLSRFNGKIFIQVHGYDITWDFVSIKTGRYVHDEKYIEFARSIANKAIYIANSEFTKSNLLKAGIPENRIRVKYFGVPCESNDQVRTYTKGKMVKILYLGRLVDCKAPDLVIKAFDYACKKGMQAELIIAGDGYLMDTCKLFRGRSKYKNKIEILGAVTSEEGARLRKECDIFTAHNCIGAITNQVESFGVSIIEAMSAGLPVVTGKSGGVVESVVDGETGFLFSPGDVKQHGELLYKLADEPDLRKRLGISAIKRINQEFTLEKEEDSLLKILEE